MPDPIDYTSAFATLPSPQAAIAEGLKFGVGLDQLQQERQQQQSALLQKQQMQADLVALSKNPTPDAIGSLMIKYPALSEQLKRGADVIEPAQQQAQLEHGTQVYAAVLNGQPDVAQRLLTERAAALRNSGNEKEAAAAETFATMIKDHPEFAKTTMGLRLASAMGPDKFAAAFKDIGAEQRAGELQPDAVREAGAKADAAVAGADSAKSKAVSDAVDAKYADASALAKLEGIRADTEFKRQSTKIAYLNAQIGRETNALKRQELQLKMQDAVRERDDKVRAKVADAESAAGSIDNMLNSIDRILSVAEEKKDGKPTGKGTALLRAAAGPLDSRLPTMQGDVADLEALVETLGSQAFLSQIPNIKGMGSLSNAEGEKLQSAFQNFSLRQSDTQLINNLKDAQRLLKTGRNSISKRYGVPLGNPNTPAAADSRPPLSSFGG